MKKNILFTLLFTCLLCLSAYALDESGETGDSTPPPEVETETETETEPTVPPVSEPTKPEKPQEDTQAPSVSVTGVHVVKSGDTLFSLAKKYNISVDTLKQLNNLTNESLSVGQVLKVRGDISQTPQSPPAEDDKKPTNTPSEETPTTNDDESDKEVTNTEDQLIGSDDEPVEDKVEKPLDQLANESIDEDLLVEGQITETTPQEETQVITPEKQEKRTKAINFYWVIGGILLLASGLTAAVVYWKRAWFLR